ncbi:alpha/beta hydrolase family protein [Roseivirga echinicomitans]
MMSFLKSAVKASFGLISALLLVGFAFNAKAQNGNLKKLEVEDYAQWESLGFSSTFSDDGNWFFYDIRRNNDKNEIRLHHLTDNSLKVLPEGSRAQFSADSRWLGYFINPTAEARKKSNRPLRSQFSLMNLNGTDSLIKEDVSSFSFSDDSQFLALKQNVASGKKSKGADLIIRNLKTGTEMNFGNVSDFAWQEKGSLMAMIIDADGKAGNGLQLFDAKTNILKVLDSKEAVYTGLQWRKESDDLAVFRSFKNEDYEDSTHHILTWQKLTSKAPIASIFDQQNVADFPTDHRVLNNRSLTWSKNGQSIFFEIKVWEQKPAKSDKKEEKNDVLDLTDEAPALQIWHSSDVKVIPEQEILARRRREDQYLAVWHLNSNRFIQLANELTESVRLQTDASILIGSDATPYEKDAMFGRGNIDAYTVDIMTGAREKILTKVNYVFAVSPDAQFVPYVEGKDVFVYDIKAKTKKNLSQGLDASFVNEDDDHPTPDKRPYGFVAWEKIGASFFVNSKYDVWQFYTNASKPRRITDGKSEQIRARYNFFNFEDYIDEKQPMYVSLFGTWSKMSGYGIVTPGKSVKRLIFENARVSRLNKAENADRFAYSIESFSDSPDFFVGSGELSDAKQISNTNPFQSEYYWGKTELVEYTNANGQRLQGSLFYPANYEVGKKYPMITYIYELLSDGIHSYVVPSQRSYYNNSVFSQEGYFVLLPDIIFDAGDPGISSVKTLEAAVKTVVDMGMVDEKKVGLIGHSWGGYQAGYAVTQTDIFAASVAGAGLTNLTSMYGMIAWAFGGAPENAHFEVSQERMEVPPYEDVDRYIRNSSVFSIENLNTPLLFEVGDNDQNVDWRQGIEYYNAARRAGKQFVLLVYANEGHGLSQDKNRADYQMRILKWFDHYLKGGPTQPWIQQGIPYETQMKELKNWKK